MSYLYQTKNGTQYNISQIRSGRYCANEIIDGQASMKGVLFT